MFSIIYVMPEDNFFIPREIVDNYFLSVLVRKDYSHLSRRIFVGEAERKQVVIN